MTTLALTQRQLEIFTFLETFLAQHGYPPTRQEIATHFGFSSANAAEQHLRALEKHGAIRMTPGVSRGIELLAETEAKGK